MKLLGRLVHETDCSVLLSTHELEIAQNLSDQLWLIHSPAADPEGVNQNGAAASSGTLAIGSPEDLALSGEFERLFTSNGVEFDQMSGRFLFGEVPVRRAALRGTGLPRRWTERALNRIGIESVEPEAEEEMGRTLPIVTVQTLSGGYLWTLTQGGVTRGFDSIASLIAALGG
jgi:iron complex transport system ATP-binding protein